MDTFSNISLAMLRNLLADTYSPKIRFMDERAPWALHLNPNLCILDLDLVIATPLPESELIREVTVNPIHDDIDEF
jgi:hypothetical protein